MNEQLQSKLVEILAGIQAATKAAGDFAIEQLPDIAQQYMVYGRVYHTARFIVGVVLTALAMAAICFCVKFAKQRREDAAFVSGGTGIVVLVIGALVAGASSSNFFLVWFAPKVWLLKEIAGLLR